MKEQLMIFTNAYGMTITETDAKQYFDHEYKHVNDYIKNGWIVVFLAGTGMASASFNRGSFAYLLERIIKTEQ